MRKKLFIGLAFAALATIGFFGGLSGKDKSIESTGLSKFQMDNIEALTQSEAEITIPCIPGGYICGLLRPDATGTYRWIKISNMTKI